MKNISVIIQARFSSTRYPGKVLEKIGNQTALEVLIKRIRKSNKISNIIVASTKSENDKKIYKICNKLKVNFYAGDENNVLKRYYQTAKKFKCQNIIRLTSDCPFLDYKIIDKIIDTYFSKNLDYCSNTLRPTFADGQDVEIFSYLALKNANKLAKNRFDKEHVTPFIKRSPKIKKYNFLDSEDLNQIRITLDEPEDLIVFNNIYNYFKNIYFSYDQIKLLYKKKKNIFFLII